MGFVHLKKAGEQGGEVHRRRICKCFENIRTQQGVFKESHVISLSQSGLYFAVKQEQEEGERGGEGGIFGWWSSAGSAGGENYGAASRL